MAPSDPIPAPLTEERLAHLREFLQPHGIEPTRWDLMNLALTHASHAYETDRGESNERLEFLGDSVISLLVSLHLYRSRRDLDEGGLSKHRARLISRSALGQIAEEIGLGPLIHLGRGEEKTGGRQRLSNLGGALEALVGAIYLDLGLDAARRFVAAVLLDRHEEIAEDEAHQDHKSRFQELVQHRHGTVPRYEVVKAEGPDHDRVFHVTVHVEGQIVGEGEGPRVKSAENRAARIALERMEKESGSGR